MTDIRHYLRKAESPAYEALCQVEQLCTSYDHARGFQLTKEIVEEFIFCETDKRVGCRWKTTPLKELQVLESVCRYFGEFRDEATKRYIFIVLFPPGAKSVVESRATMLGKLVSIALAVKNGYILNCAGMWMQLNKCSSESSCHVAETLISDFFKLNPATLGILKDLPAISPLFAASLITSLTYLYAASPPPPKIVELVSLWVQSSPSLCVAPLQMTQMQPYSCPVPQMPLPGLLLWCVISPFQNRDGQLTSESSSTKEPPDLVFSHLHLLVLETMLKAGQARHELPNIHLVMPPEGIFVVIAALKQKLHALHALDGAAQMAMDRLAQALQVAQNTFCFQGKRAELFSHLEHLPQNKLLKIVLNKWQMP